MKEIKLNKAKRYEMFHGGNNKGIVSGAKKELHSATSIQQEKAIDHQVSKLRQSKKNCNEYLQYAKFTELTKEMVHTFVKAVYINSDCTINICCTFNQK